MFTIPFTAAAKRRKQEKAILAAASTYYWSYEDIKDLSQLKSAIDARDIARCRSLLEELDPPKSFAAAREWLDILVVSISVAMAFRAYFYEPFNIPTGSMQPTLYGNHSVACSPAEADFFDKGPQKWLKWLVTGKYYECFRAESSGILAFASTNTGYYDMRVLDSQTRKPGKRMLIPTDVLHPTETGDGPYRHHRFALPNGLGEGSFVREGQILWSGYVVTGDFLFVNRWLWNFRHPKRGDVMIFSTTGIAKLQQGTHYIKRMTGTPGEKLQIREHRLLVNGVEPMEPLRIAQIQKREKWHEKEYPYAGYQVSGRAEYTIPGKTLVNEDDTVTLGADEYYACGDNSPSSYDSRYWGPVPGSNLRGIAGGVFWPFSHRWGPIR